MWRTLLPPRQTNQHKPGKTRAAEIYDQLSDEAEKLFSCFDQNLGFLPSLDVVSLVIDSKTNTKKYIAGIEYDKYEARQMALYTC